MNTNFTRELMFGKRPVHRTDPKPGQSEWYYLDPRGADNFSDMKQIDVSSENSPNPYANEIQNYLYKNDAYNYKELYGNTPPPTLNQPTLVPIDNTNSYTTESAWGYPNNTQSPYYQQMGKPYNMNQSYLSGMANIQRNINTLQPTNYSLYGDGFSKEFIDKMENDAEFQKILNEYIIPNEGGYSNKASDRGGKTNYGISQKTYYKEDIPNLTRKRANAIIYRDFYNWNGLNKLPYPIRGFVVDYGMPTSPLNAIQTVHKVLDLPPNGNIIGSSTMEKLNNFSEDDYVNFLNSYKKEMYKYYHGLVARDPAQKENLNGWLNRANKAHLAK